MNGVSFLVLATCTAVANTHELTFKQFQQILNKRGYERMDRPNMNAEPLQIKVGLILKYIHSVDQKKHTYQKLAFMTKKRT